VHLRVLHPHPEDVTGARDDDRLRLLHRHFRTLVDDDAQWRTLIADDLVWELADAPSIGHPAKRSGREAVVHHVTWFVGAVENDRSFDSRVCPFADPEGATTEVKAEGLRRGNQGAGAFTGSVARRARWKHV
jgi:hypothetical protein